MPIYDYGCLECGHLFEVLVTSDEGVVCLKCGSEKVERKLSAPGRVGAASSGGGLQCGRETTCCGASEPCEKPGCHK